MAKKVVVLGAGFGGIRAALDLNKHKDLQVVLINDSSSHCYHPDLYELASAHLSQERRLDFDGVRGTVSIPLREIFSKGQVEIVIGLVEAVDLGEKSVKVQSGVVINYDFLILALGSTTNYFGIEGAKDYSHKLKNAEDALNIRNDLEEIGRSNKDKLHTVIIAGGGFTGVELSGELVHFLPKNFKVIVIEAGKEILSGMSEWAREKAHQRLEKSGVEVLINCPIKKVEEGKLIAGENEIGFDYLIWTAGVVGNNLGGKISDVELNKHGRVQTEQDLSLGGFPEVFVIGDLAEVIDDSGNPVPATAWAAIGEASIVARNILARLMEEKTFRYTPSSPGFVVPIGGMYAITNLFGLEVSGILAWFIKRLIALNYFLSILPFSSAVLIWWKGVKISFKNDKS